MRWDCESVAKRGSRLLGLASMRKVSEEGSLREDDEQEMRQNEAIKQRRKDVKKRQARAICVGGLARRGIRNFTENGGAARAGGRREVRGAPVERLVREQGEGQGFLGVFGNAEAGRGQDLDAGKSGGELGEN